MAIRILSWWRLQQLRWKPQHALGFVRRHQLGNNGLEISQHLDLRQRLFLYWIHSRPRRGLITRRQISDKTGRRSYANAGLDAL